MKKFGFAILFVAFLVGTLLAVGNVYYSLAIWKYEGADKIFEIKRGEGFGRVNSRLINNDLIKSAKIFHRYAQVNGLMTKLKAGKFVIKKGSTMLEVFETLLHGQSIAVKVTIPEGKNLFEIAKILEAKGITKENEFIQLAKSPQFARELGIEASRLEGYLYPDTYNFTPGASAKEILRQFVRVFNLRTKKIDFSKAPNDLTPAEVIILASIVEKETGATFERPIIAGVYHNRLTKKMRLYADPTTIYGIWETFNGNLKRKHLREKTAYNTYKISGLPAGPIANPGIESIKAVINPEPHRYLYFVSRNDGTHIFSTNYKDHQRAVDKFQKNRKMRQNKSWRQLSNSKKNQ